MGSDPLFTDGVIVINKPPGPTSHDIVAVMRRAIRRSTMDDRKSPIKVGHTGTLDPLASGVLPLVLGKATRLAQFLSSAEKEYEAEIELGVSTTTLDRGGEIVASRTDPRRRRIDAIDDRRRGGRVPRHAPAAAARVFRQEDRRRSRIRSRAQKRTGAAASRWRSRRLATRRARLARNAACTVRLVCSAGYYVRSLAEALGERLGTGAHLAALVRTRSGDFTLRDAVDLDVLDRRPSEAAGRVIPLTALLPSLPALTLTPEGASLAAAGRVYRGRHTWPGRSDSAVIRAAVKLLHPDGHLIAIAEPRPAGPGRSSVFCIPAWYWNKICSFGTNTLRRTGESG